jgi:hypothetical protein
MNKLSSIVLALSIVGLAACASETSPSGDKTDSTANGGAAGEQLVFYSQTDARVTGAYTVGTDTATFDSIVQAEGIIAVTLKLRGLTLDATVDHVKTTASFDGFASSGGSDTQLLDGDRAALVRLTKALRGALPGDASVRETLRNVASVWSETSSSMKLNHVLHGEAARTTSLCGNIGTWNSYARHGGSTDQCDGHDYNSSTAGNCSQRVWIGNTGVSPTVSYQWSSGAWSDDQSQMDHANWPWEHGDCFGACGSGCGSSKYTQACLDHDGCVRNGHWIAGLTCDLIFPSASWDYLWARGC